MKASRRLSGIAALALSTACGQAASGAIGSSRVLVAPSPWPSPQVRTPDAPPRIQALWMNETTIRAGSVWEGRVVTSTNVASVELRTESFSFVAQRQRFGVFDFSQTVLDVIPQYRRAYLLHVIVRNTRGDATERRIPIVIR